ncbi:UDP-N-acetylmuramate--L-alanine ligase [Candidatus Microgenomates bacterium]|nr:MAG: UDP-N-acetylmuramate--L-alanine ligase [Candidatus Microgenomates bacterium]
MQNQFNLQEIKHIHFTGIKGVAMTALAIIAKQMGKMVSGSDIDEIFPTDETLSEAHIAVSHGFKPENVPADTELLIYTGAHNGHSNPEVVAAAQKGIPVLPQGKALGIFMADKRAISVAGSHGKTTTSAFVATLLESAGLHPSFAVGCGAISHLHTSGQWGSGAYFVAEADEYVTDPSFDSTPRFLWQDPEILVITNIDFDHPDVYENLEAVQAAFAKLIRKMPDKGLVIINADDQPSVSLLPHIKQQVITYGLEHESDFRIKNIAWQQDVTRFELHTRAGVQIYEIRIAGTHNVLNATAAIIAAHHVGLDQKHTQQGLSAFVGTKRRFEIVSEKNGKLLIDDYAHHPHEIKATLEASRKRYPNKRLVVIFQPHTYSRTQALLSEFANSFIVADEVVITDIYASAREQKVSQVSGETLVEKIKLYNKNVYYHPDRASVIKYISSQTHQNDVIMTMGAGDIFTWLGELVTAL